jgi:hypothetical protein
LNALSLALAPQLAKWTPVGEAGLAQQLGQPRLRLGVVQVADVPQLVGLLMQRGQQIGIAIAQRVDGDARHAVQVLAPLGVDDRAAVSMVQDKVRPRVDL